MRKLYTAAGRLFASALFMIFVLTSVAQTNIARYSFNSSIGTYTPLSGGTVVWTTWDFGSTDAIPLGGTFTFGGVAFTTCFIGQDGMISFGAAQNSSSILSTSGSATGAIAGWTNDGANSTMPGTTPSVRYANIGGPTGEFVVQYADHARWGTRATERINFQIRLNLATNQVSIVYGTYATISGATASTAQVGIRGNSTDWATNVNNVMLDNVPAGTNCGWTNTVTGNANSSTTLTTPANTALNIPNGLTFTWTPQNTVAPVRVFSAVSAITTSGATVSWTAPTGATQYNVQYRALGSCSWTNHPGNPVAGTTATIAGLNPATVYQVRVQASNGTENTIWSHIPNQAGTGNGYTATGTFTTAAIASDIQAVELISPGMNPLNCYTSAVPVRIRIRNAGTDPLDFSTNNATVSVNITGPNPTTQSVVVSTGTLAANATQDVTVIPSYNMSAPGTYTFNGNVVLATPDANTSNDAIPQVTRTTSTAASLPQIVTFDGYTGSPGSLSANFPGWTEGSGAVTPVIGGDGSFTSVTAAAQLALYGPAAKINLWNTLVGWIISPVVVPTANHEFRFKATLTTFNGTTAASFGDNDTVRIMVSTDCGSTWNAIRTFTNNNNHGLDNSTNAFRQFSESLSAYAGQQILVAIYARRTPTASTPDIDLIIDDLQIDLPIVCFEPTALTVSALAATTAEIEWTAPNNGTPASYDVFLATTNTNPAVGATATFTGAQSPYTISSLTPNTTYFVWVRSNCGVDGTSYWTQRGTFTTLCGAVSTFSQNFDAVTTPALPACWRRVSTVGTASTQNTNASSAPNTLNINSPNATDLVVVSMPPVNNLAAATHRLRFKARASATVGGNFEVGYLTSITDVNSFVTLQSFTASTLTYQDFEVIPTALPGVEILAFRHNGSPANAVLIDDVHWEAIPTCDVPTALLASSITSTGVDIDWTMPAMGSPLDYQIFIATNNTPPTGATTPTVTGAMAPQSVTGLNPSTPYWVWVRTNCGSGDVSAWAGPLTFTTPCAPITTLPWTENFDTLSTIGLTNFPSCWFKENGDWRTANAATWTQNDPRSAPNYLTNSWSATNEFMWTPGFQLTAGESYDFSFWFTGDGFTGWTGDVFYNTVQNSTGATQLGGSFITPGTTSVATYAQVKNTFIAPTTDVYYFAIRINANSTPWYIGFDDFRLEETPTCTEPTALNASGITTTDAMIDWTTPSTGAPLDYEVFYSTSPVAPTASSTPNMVGAFNPVMLTGLTPSSTYYVWVRTNCGGGDKSVWAGPLTFTTLCAPIATLPWTENFDALTTIGLTNFPACWLKENGDWRTANAATWTQNDPRSNPNYLTNAWSATNEFMWTPGFDLVGGTAYDFSFWFTGDGFTGWTGDVFYNTSQQSAGATQLGTSFITAGTTSVATYQQVKNTFVPPADGVYYFAIRINANATPWYIGFDDFRMELAPTCLPPTALTVSALGSTTATVDWAAPIAGTPNDYDVFVSTTNTPPTAATTPTLTGQQSPANLTALSADTPYWIWVRSNCGSGDLSEWSAVLSFRTLCAPVSDFTQNFDGVTVPALPSCWRRVTLVGTAATQASNANSAPNTLNMSSPNTTNLSVVAMPPVNNLGAATHRLRFRMRASVTAGGIIEVGYLSNAADAATFIALQSFTASSLTYQQFEVMPSALPGVQVMAFRHTGSPTNAVLIDDVIWEAMPACVEPGGIVISHISSSGALVNFTAPATGTPVDYQVFASTTNTPPGAGTTPTATTANSPAYLSSLTSNTPYWVWVRTNCGAGGTSAWSNAVSFRTICDSVALPLSNGFNGASMPNCWSARIAAVQTGSKISFVTNASNLTALPQEGSHFVMYNSFSATNGGSGSQERLISAPLATHMVSGINVNFHWFENGGTQYATGNYLTEGVTVEWSTNGDAWTSTTFFPRHVDGAPANGHWVQKSVTIPVASGQGQTLVAFRFTSAFGYNMYLDNISFQAASPLPVTLISFSGENAGSSNRLTWSTSSEVNNKGFELERSADGRNFSSIGFVATKAEGGNSNVTIHYAYSDNKPLGGTNYYRLKQVDRDGQFTYSNVVELRTRVSDIRFSSVYPNPTNRDLNLVISSPGSERVTIVVTDLTGKVILQQAAQLMMGDNQARLNVQQLSAGTYIIKAICANGCESAVHRFVKH